MNLTAHFTLEELIRSEIAMRRSLDNSAPAFVIENLRQTSTQLELVRDLVGCPIQITSGYRSPNVNAAIGGSRGSQHMTGEAVDFIAPGYGSPLQVCRAIVKSGIEFDQLIHEGTWVHLSFSRTGAQRRQALTAHFGAAGVRYTPGI